MPEDTSQDADLEQLVNSLDSVILAFPHMANHNIAGVLLSRVTLLMQTDPVTGKGLVRYVWEKLDEIEQANPGNML